MYSTNMYGGDTENMLYDLYKKADNYNQELNSYMKNQNQYDDMYGGSVNSDNFKYMVDIANKLKAKTKNVYRHADYVKIASMIIKSARSKSGATENTSTVKSKVSQMIDDERELSKIIDEWKKIPPKEKKAKKSKKSSKGSKSGLSELRRDFASKLSHTGDKNKRISNRRDFTGGYDNEYDEYNVGDKSGTYY